MTQYNPGDLVRVRSDLVEGAHYGLLMCVSGMLIYRGKLFEVMSITAGGNIRLKNASFIWSDGMVEPYSEETDDVLDIPYNTAEINQSLKSGASIFDIFTAKEVTPV